MGQDMAKPIKPEEEKTEIDVNNGLILGGTYMPVEIMTLILSFLEPDVLVKSARRVCSQWHNIVTENHVWYEKVLREVPNSNNTIFFKKLTWKDYYLLCKHKPLNRNLLLNGSATEGLKSWRIPNRSFGGQDWKIEKEPTGCDGFPSGITRCFVTSYDWCRAEQSIKLSDLGLTTEFMDEVRPDIHIEEWYAGRFDCGFNYTLKVTLLNSNWENLVEPFVFKTTEHTTDWKKVSHVFTNYPEGLAEIHFHHKGKDTQFWAGHYGCKMSGAKVWLSLRGNDSLNSNSNV